MTRVYVRWVAICREMKAARDQLTPCILSCSNAACRLARDVVFNHTQTRRRRRRKALTAVDQLAPWLVACMFTALHSPWLSRYLRVFCCPISWLSYRLGTLQSPVHHVHQ